MNCSKGLYLIPILISNFCFAQISGTQQFKALQKAYNERTYDSLLEHYKESNNLNMLGKIYLLKAQHDIKHKRADSVVHFLKTGLAEIRPTKNDSLLSNFYLWIAACNMKSGNNKIAIKNYNMAKPLVKFPTDSARLYAALGLAHYNMDSLQMAKSHYTRALTIYSALNDSLGMGNIIANLGNVKYANGDYGSAIAHYKRALDILRANGTNSSWLQSIIGSTYLEQKSYTLAKKHLDSAMALAEQKNSSYWLRFIYDKKRKLHEETGEIDKAYHYYKLYITERDSLTAKQTKNELIDIENKYDFELKQKELEAKNAEIKLLRNIQLIGLLCVTFLIGLVGYIIWSSTKLKRQKRHITKINKELSDLNVLKDNFLSIISHEYRSPLATIKTTFLRVKSEGYNPAFFEKFINHTYDEIDKTINLIDSLLSWSKLRLSESKAYTNFDLQNTVKTIKALYTDELKSKGLALNTAIALDTILGPEQLIHYLLKNLVSNAIKYSPNDGHIMVSAFEKEGYYVFSVSDQGKGVITTEDGEIKALEIKKGNGIALKLGKSMLEEHNGDLWVTQNAETKLTTFNFKIKAVS